jgi:muramidase (phage lysozyme)
MDKTVPPGAAFLLRFIYETEVSRTPPSCYEVIYGHNEKKLPKSLTSMTLGEVVDAQKGWSKNFGSSAAGAAQFMRATLQGLAKELGLNGNQKFDADFQDRLAYHLLKRRGYEAFIAGKISRTEFGKRLAQEWASFPVLADVQGGSRKVKRGQSYYAGDGLNKSLVTPEEVEDILDQVKAIAAAPVPADAPKPVPVPVPVPELQPAPVASGGFWAWLKGWF